MGQHNSHNMHDNSKASWRLVDMSKGEREVCEVYAMHGWMTDREVWTALGTGDSNRARPVITTLRDAGMIVEHEDAFVCDVTGRSVRKCRMADHPVYVKVKHETDREKIARLESELAV